MGKGQGEEVIYFILYFSYDFFFLRLRAMILAGTEGIKSPFDSKEKWSPCFRNFIDHVIFLFFLIRFAYHNSYHNYFDFSPLSDIFFSFF